MRLSVKSFGRVVAACIALGIISLSTGCTSGFSAPKWLSWNRTPDPDTLAAKGPTTTFPSPSSTQTPNAIVSSAATGSKDSTTKSVGTVDPKAGYGTPAAYASTAKATAPTTPSMAAAQANGYASAAQPAGYVPGGMPAANPYGAAAANAANAYTGQIAGAAQGYTQQAAGAAQGYANQANATAQGYANQATGAAQGYANQASGAVQNYANQASNAVGAYTAPGSAYNVPPAAGYTQPAGTSPYGVAGAGATPNGLTNGSTYSIPNTYATPSNYAAAGAATSPSMSLPGQPADSGYRTADASAGSQGAYPGSAASAPPYGTNTQANPYTQPATNPNSGYRPGSTGRPTGYSTEPNSTPIYR